MKMKFTKQISFCRGCDEELPINTRVFYTYSHRNRGQHVLFCMNCLEKICAIYEEDLPLFLKEKR